MTTEEITIAEVKRLDAGRTKGTYRAVHTDDGHDTFPEKYSTIVSEQTIDGENYKRELIETTLEKDARILNPADADFFAAAPRIAALAIQQAEKIEELQEKISYLSECLDRAETILHEGGFIGDLRS